MASNKQGGRARWRGTPIALKALALCLIAVVALLLLLPAPPDNSSGGITRVSKHVPKLRDTVDPLAKAPPPDGQVRIQAPPASVEAPPPKAVTPEPEPAPQPKVVTAPEAPPPSPPAPAPARKPSDAGPAVGPDSVVQGSETRTLPWRQKRDVARLPEEPTPEVLPGRSAGLPSKSDIREWVKSQAWEFLGGVDPEGNILYRFEVWLEAPPDALSGIKSVSYEYDAPSATPKVRDVSDAKSGFRARFGSLACAKKVTITVTIADGRTRRAVADGCQALN